jgi:hypothetical protein
MVVKRFPDWEIRLHQEIESARGKKFAWGSFDCALFACDCILAMTGEDLAAAYRGKYSDEAGAGKLVGESLLRFAHDVAMTAGMIPQHANFARRGDLVLVNNGTPLGALGIVSHHGHFAWCAADGLARVKMHRWMLSWKVGA